MNNKDLVFEHIECLWNRGEYESIGNILSERFFYKTSFTDEILDASQYVEFLKMFHKSMPDLSVNIELVMSENNHAVSQISFSGDIKFSFYGIPATNKIISFTAISVWEIFKDKIVSIDTLMDLHDIERQIGAPILSKVPLKNR